MRLFLCGVVGAALLAAPRAWPAQDDVSRCAVCHGERGKGDGPLNASLKTPAPIFQKFRGTTWAYFLLTGFTELSMVAKWSRRTDRVTCQCGEVESPSI
jgi:hypothetical protein